MRKSLLVIVCLFILGCQKQVTYLKYDFLPKPLNVDSIFYPIPKADTAKLNSYPFIAIEKGTAKVCDDDSCKKLKDVALPAGTLFSDKATAEYAYYRIVVPTTNERMVINKALFKNYQINIYKADSLYNDRIVFLEKQNERSWLEKNLGYIGFLCGTAFAILIESVTVKAIK